MALPTFSGLSRPSTANLDVAFSELDKSRSGVISIFDSLTASEIADVLAFTYINDLGPKIDAAQSAAAAAGKKLYLPAGGYLRTTPFSLPERGHVIGEKASQLPTSYGIAPKATTIKFVPSSLSDCIKLSGTIRGTFRLHNSIQGINFVAGNSNARYGFDCDHGIYGKYSNLGFEGFQYGVNCNGTINNRFSNIHITGSTAASARYAGAVETTDVWDQCTLSQCPTAIVTLGSNVGIRWSNCLFEQVQTYLADIARETQSMMFDNCYGEDLCFSGSSTSAAFRVGVSGATTVGQTHLIINGGHYAGRNAGAVGSFLDIDYCTGVIVGGMTVSRFTNGIKTTSNTTSASVVSRGWTALSLSNIINHAGSATDYSRISGNWPAQVIGAGAGNGQRLRVRLIESEYDVSFGRSLLGPNANFSGAASGVAGTLGLGNETASTVGSAGGASSLPITPLGYLIAYIGTTPVKIPYYNN